MIYDKLKMITIYGIGGAVFLGLLWLTLKFALPILLPFIIAYVIAYALRAGAKRLSGLTRMNENILRAIILALAASAAGFILWFGASAAIREIRDALDALSRNLADKGGITEHLKSLVAKLGERFGGRDVSLALTDFVSGAASKASSYIASLAASAVSALPSFAIGCAIGVAALFYFTFGYEKAAKAIKSALPKKQREKICACSNAAVRGLGRFVRSYSAIILVTFAELFIGFLILGIDHAFVLAVFISIVDFLPILGVGGVLVPWAAVSFVMGNTYQAIGLLVMLVIIWAVRQPVESKLVGRGAGVHPIFALAAVYAGFRLAGVFGMIAAPVLLTAGSVIFKENSKDIW